MGMPAATQKSGDICFAFPDVCKTPPPAAGVPIPYPNIGQLSAATDVATTVKIGGNPTVTQDSHIPNSTGDEAGIVGGILSKTFGGPVIFKKFSQTVKAEGGGIVRMGDTTGQNCDGTSSSATANAFGNVLGGEPTVLVGD